MSRFICGTYLLKNAVHITHAYPIKQKTAEPNNRKTQKKELKKRHYRTERQQDAHPRRTIFIFAIS
jgi:hypothetical protein